MINSSYVSVKTILDGIDMKSVKGVRTMYERIALAEEIVSVDFRHTYYD